MQRILSLSILLAFCLVSHAEGYFSGVWYCTKAPTVGERLSGALDITFYTDNSLDADIYFDGVLWDTFVGTVQPLAGGKYRITFVDSDGWIYTGIWNPALAFVYGSFKSASGGYKGKFQLTFIRTDGDAAKVSTVESQKSAPQKAK